MGIALAVVDDHGALPPSLFVVVQLAEIGDNVLPRPSLGTKTFDQGVIRVRLAVLVAGVAPQEHAALLNSQDDQGAA